MPESDDELIARLLIKDEGAYRLVISRHHGAMVRLARGIVGAGIAEDVVQESWVKAIGGLSRFERRSNLRSWLLRIVRNEAISRLRQQARLPEHESLDCDGLDERFGEGGQWRVPPAAWAQETPESLLAAKQLRSVIERGLSSLPEMQRTVLTLRDGEGLSFGEICNILEISASHARVLLHRGRSRLWALIDEHQRS